MTSMLRDGPGPAASRSIEAAALVGIAHVVLSSTAAFLYRRAPTPAESSDVVSWYLEESNQRSIVVAVNLTAISSIAFLWFVAVIRRRVGDRENRFFGTVFFGSALLVIASWLLGSVLISAPAFSPYLFGVSVDASDVALFRAAGLATTSLVATRLEAVFILSTTTVGRLSGAFPRWLVVVGYAIGATLLLVPLPNDVLSLVFPVWVLVACVSLLVKRREFDPNLGEGGVSASGSDRS